MCCYIISDHPVEIQPYVLMINALVAAWLPETEGQGVADVVFGDYGFTGKLPRTWFKSVRMLMPFSLQRTLKPHISCKPGLSSSAH
ncbi:hypothetical protein EV2_031771 [Malus domestica]